MYEKKTTASKFSDDGRVDRADATQRAFLASSGGQQRVEPYGSENFQGWGAFEREESSLIKWAKEEGIYTPNPCDLVAGHILKGGATEHDVYLMVDSMKYILRSTIRDSYGHPHLRASPAQYLQRLVDYNSIFVDTPIEIVAVSSNERGNAAIWTRQPYIEGRHFDSPEDLRDALELHGWQKVVEKFLIFRHIESGIEISDVSEGNVIESSDGELRFIDVIVENATEL